MGGRVFRPPPATTATSRRARRFTRRRDDVRAVTSFCNSFPCSSFLPAQVQLGGRRGTRSVHRPGRLSDVQPQRRRDVRPRRRRRCRAVSFGQRPRQCTRGVGESGWFVGWLVGRRECGSLSLAHDWWVGSSPLSSQSVTTHHLPSTPRNAHAAAGNRTFHHQFVVRK